MAELHIAYDPYTQKFSGQKKNETGFSDIGKSPEAHELMTFLGKEHILQTDTEQFLNCLENYCRKSGFNQIRLCFRGTSNDFEDFTRIFGRYRDAHPDSQLRLEERQRPENTWLKPEDCWTKIKEVIEKELTSNLSKNILKTVDEQEKNPFQIVVTGRQNAGKSTFINALLGRSLLPTSIGVETYGLFSVRNAGEEPESVTLKHDNGEDQLKIVTTGKEDLFSEQNAWRDPRWKELRDKLNEELQNIANDRGAFLLEDVLKVVNGVLKEPEAQTQDYPWHIKLVEAKVKDFSLDQDGQPFELIDMPGANAARLKKAHEKLINQRMKDVTSAMLLYIFSSDGFTNDDTQSWIQEHYSNFQNQIDFNHALYIINKADSLDAEELGDYSTGNSRTLVVECRTLYSV